MKKYILLVSSNLRRAKGQTAALAALILLAAFMLNLWLMLAMDYKQNFNRYHDELNAEHVTFAAMGSGGGLKESILQILENDSRTTDYCLDDSMCMVGSFEYNGGQINTNFLILDKETALSRPVGKIEFVEDSEYAGGVYLPMLYKTGDLDVGSTLELTIGSNTLSYTICGFINSVMTGSHNCVLCTLVLTEDKYQELKETGYAPQSVLASVRISDPGESEDFETMLHNSVSAQYPDALTVSNSYALVFQSRYISQMICSSILNAMAFFILLIALVVISSNIIHYIQENMKNLGALKAVGYTSRQLILPLLLQFEGVSLTAAAAGAGLSYLLFPMLNAMMISQTGIPYAVRFLPLPLLLSLVILEGTIALAVWLSARRIRNIEPITALRQGIRTHNFKRNPILLEKTKLPLLPALSLKTTLSGIKQNVTVCVTMLVLSLVVVFSGLMIENFIRDMTPFLEMIVGEVADSCININAEAEEEFLQAMSADERVEKIYLYHSLNVSHADGISLLAMICDDFSKVNNQKVCIEGRFPKYDNEMALAAKYAKEQGLKIGNEITLTAGGNEASYLISGFTQMSNNLGKDCLLTRAGYEKLGGLDNVSYYLNLTADTDVDAFNADTKTAFPEDVNTVINVLSVVEGGSSVYLSLMTIIVIAILILSIAIIVFVLYLLIRTMLKSKMQEYGIMKALGYTTGQLILQTAASFMPAVILSAAVGLIVCSFMINPLLSVFLSEIGIVTCTFRVPAGFIILAGMGLVLFTFGTACALSVKIRKIAPRMLLSGE